MRNRMLKISVMLMAVLMFVCCFAGCNKEEATTTTAATTTAATTTAPKEDDKYGGTATFVIDADPMNINYHASAGGNTDCQIMITTGDLFCLWNEEKGEYEGRLIESWEHNEDYTVWTMHVRENAKWHDGVDVTAEDFKFTFDYLRSPDLDINSEYGAVETSEVIEVIDEHTYTVTTPEPNPNELSDWYTPLAKHVWENVDPGNFSKDPAGICMVGAGPYKMTEYKVGEYIRFDAFDDYWNGRPYIDTIYFRIIGDSTAALTALKSGQVDCFTVPQNIANQVTEDGNLYTWSGSAGNVLRFYMNLSKPEFQDKAVRQAFAHLMDRDTYVSSAMLGFADPAYNDFAPTDWYYAGNKFDKYEYSLDKAKEVLENAGWKVGADGIREKDGMRLSFKVIPSSSVPATETSLLIMTPEFKEAGIELILDIIDANAQTELWDTHDYDCFFGGTTMGPNPVRYQYIFAVGMPEGNIMMYHDPEMDAMFADAGSTFDEAGLIEKYDAIQQKLADDITNIPLWYRHTIYGLSNRLNIEDAGATGFVHFRFYHIEKAYIVD